VNKRIALALIELGEAYLDYVEGGAGGNPPPPPAAAAFASAAPAAVTSVGECPRHHIPWRTTKGDGSPAKRAYCSEKDDGQFCPEKGPWLQSR
jgi:hypothetical protein